jgi:hypothetical protein
MLGLVKTVTIHHEVDPPALEYGKPASSVVPLFLKVPADDPAKESPTVHWNGYVAVRKVGTLEIDPDPRDMEVIDTVKLPPPLGREKVHAALSYVAEAPVLALQLTKYEYSVLTTTAVNLLYMKTILTDNPRQLLTRATLMVRNVERKNIEFQLPPTSELLYFSIEGQKEEPKKLDDGSRLVSIPASTEKRETIPLVIVYQSELGGSMGVWGSSPVKSPLLREAREITGEEKTESRGRPLPVQRIELDLWAPDDYIYLNWSGNMKRDPDRPEKELVKVTDPYSLPTENLKKSCFSSFAPVVELELSYMAPKLFYFLEVAIFLLVLAGGLLLGLMANIPRLWTSVGAVLLPLFLAWLLWSPVSILLWAGFWGGLLAALTFAVLWTAPRVADWRKARLAMAPDPYLEEAPSPTPAPEQADESAGEDDAETDSGDSAPTGAKKKTKKRARKKTSKESGRDSAD